MNLAGHTLDEARRAIATQLRKAKIESPELDARLLLGDVLQLDLTGLITAATRRLDTSEAQRLEDVIRRRIAGEPVARILGRREFWGLTFALSPATLVPRPDTETLIEAVLDILKREGRTAAPLRILDIGTGSGAILLALLSELPNTTGIGTDINPAAIATAADNAATLGLASRATFVACDYAGALRGPFDIVVSNPPYIPTADIDHLDLEVRAHDPRLALDGGADGLTAYRTIAPLAFALLAPSGIAAVEIGQRQAHGVATLMAEAGLAVPAPAKADLGGVPRVVTARKT
ncbi:protein-(glutamine-N5) methyltransferase [Afipia carboxidovorans OM5]|uniref:Release factor glutamine methyltransferase n=1 Tax=Afipia carboxidovorans (strain ATCC 49405 / DSM 1227 / KCTC 32145 / OM5) TaxID=504832 RepID=B6JA07_AFIC5|nr:peptide chain release factor N(5)-glutamine methyltransferase [Afipia carboxidovorans]ACI91250.1 protein-(glutamine-N5) methyltransferase [Afipia carboxidovorans OM5]AEI01561.1 modification methylase, HemK family [Afipia carboxidovorans OM4]AEI05136.1 modification methylase, HemK family [Afipia carboxidovorans OM5]